MLLNGNIVEIEKPDGITTLQKSLFLHKFLCYSRLFSVEKELK